MWLTCCSTASIVLSFGLNKFTGSLSRSCFLTRFLLRWHHLVLCLLSVTLTVSFLFSSRLFLTLQLRGGVLLLLTKFYVFFFLLFKDWSIFFLFKHAWCAFVWNFHMSHVLHFHGLHNFLGQVTDACLLLTFMFIIVQCLIHRLI